MSRVAKCLDNAPMESFWSHFKVECYSWKKYKTYEELVEDINDYIEFYNTQRYQTTEQPNSGRIPKSGCLGF